MVAGHAEFRGGDGAGYWSRTQRRERLMSENVFWVQFCVNYAVLLAGLIGSILAGLS